MHNPRFAAKYSPVRESFTDPRRGCHARRTQPPASPMRIGLPDQSLEQRQARLISQGGDLRMPLDADHEGPVRSFEAFEDAVVGRGADA